MTHLPIHGIVPFCSGGAENRNFFLISVRSEYLVGVAHLLHGAVEQFLVGKVVAFLAGLQCGDNHFTD